MKKQILDYHYIFFRGTPVNITQRKDTNQINFVTRSQIFFEKNSEARKAEGLNNHIS